MKNDNHVLAEFAKDVRVAGLNDYLALPWDKAVKVGADHQAAIVALYENGLLGFKASASGGKVYSNANTSPLFRMHSQLGSIIESVLVVSGLAFVVSIGTRLSDFVGMALAGFFFLALFVRGLQVSRYFHLYSKVWLDADCAGRIRNGLMFLTSWFSAAVAVYFYRRLFVLGVYDQGSLSLLDGLSRTFSDGIWWSLLGHEILGWHPGGVWWQYALGLSGFLIIYAFVWYFVGAVVTVGANANAANQLLVYSGMQDRFGGTICEGPEQSSAKGKVALYSSLLVMFVVFYSIHFLEKVVGTLF